MILKFRGKREEREIEEWKQKVIAHYLPRALEFQAYLDDAKRRGFSFEPETLAMVHQRSFEAMGLYWMGLPPEEQDELVQQLAPAWARLEALRARNKALADRALAQAKGTRQ